MLLSFATRLNQKLTNFLFRSLYQRSSFRAGPNSLITHTFQHDRSYTILTTGPKAPEFTRMPGEIVAHIIEHFGCSAALIELLKLRLIFNKTCLVSSSSLGKLMGSLSVSDHISCAVKQCKLGLARMLLLNVSQNNGVINKGKNVYLPHLARLVVRGGLEVYKGA